MNVTDNHEGRPRSIAGIVRNRIDEVKAIQSLLADVYRDAGDGRTLFRELVQNADDSGARQLKFAVLESGWRDARNSLLRGPALLVANDGPFPARDREALHMAIGGSKEGDVDKIGTFGIGLKSVFHICEAFLYIGADQSEWWPDVLNPWWGTGRDGSPDPLFPDWDVVDEHDQERLRVAVKPLLGETDTGLLLWIPLRRHEHDRGADGGRFWLSDYRPNPRALCSWFDCSAPAALLLAQCRHLQTIDARHAANPEALGDSATLMRVARPAERWLGRYQEESSRFLERPFRGEIEARARKWSVVGIESLDGERLRNLRYHPDWPQVTPNWNGRYLTEPRKALAHAAVTVIRPVERDAHPLGMRLRWAAFLPLDDHPNPSSSTIVESYGSSPAWEIVLHGYFWPSQDRRSIPGVTDQGDPPSYGDMRDRWNRRLCEELLLPLLPRALAEAVEGVDEPTARGLLKRVEGSDILRNRMPHVTRRHWLLPEVAQNRVHWRAIDAQHAERVRVLSIPKWDQAPKGVRAHFLASCREGTGDAVFIEEIAPRLSGDLDEWTIDHLDRLLHSIPADSFASTESLRWIARAVRHALGQDHRREDPRTAAFVRWLVQRISEGALAPTARPSVSRETPTELREAWRDLCAAIPPEWLVETPVGTRQAVEELTSRNRIIGKGLFLLPTRLRSSESRPTLHHDNEQLDRALIALGERLQVAGESQRLRRSRLLLAETLLSIRPDSPMDDGMCGLPLFRATRFPEDNEEAWSVADLRCQIENRRVFASPRSEPREYDGKGRTRSETTSDPRRAVAELATALDEPVWLVNGDAVVFVAADVPTPEPETLADAVLRAGEFAEPDSRARLLRRLVSNKSGDASVRLAARVLLAGRAADVVGLDTEFFQVRGGHERALLILLRLLDRSWCAVDRELAGSLTQDTLEDLSVGQVDLEALHRVLDECLIGQVDWTALRDEEVVHLLRRLYSPEPKTHQRWRRAPLHRDIDGVRGPFDDRAMRSGRTSEFVLPPELRTDVTLLDPDPEVSDLYEAVPELDGDRVLQRMLEDSQPRRFAERIVRHVRSDVGPVSLPPDRDLCRLLKTSRWLPDRDGEGLAPEAVLIAPEAVLNAVHDLAKHGAFRDKRLPDAVDPGIWQTAEPVVREILGRMGHARQLERMVDALASDRVAEVDGGAWLVMPEAGLPDDLLIDWALQTTLVGSHPGWKLLHTVDRILRHRESQSSDNPQPLLRLARLLCGPVPWERQIEMLTLVTAGRPPKGSPDGRMFRRLLGCFAETEGFFDNVLPNLHLPTQDGNWHASREVARTETGVARRHLLLSELRPVLRLSDADRQLERRTVRTSEPVSEPLRVYFKAWRDRLPPGAVGAFLSLLGSGSRGEIAGLAKEWLGEDFSIEGMRSELIDRNGEDPCASVCVWVWPSIQRGDRVRAANVIGEWVDMEATPSADTLFATDPVWYKHGSMWGIAPPEPFWQIELRDVDPQSLKPAQLTDLLGGTVERWATKYLKLDRERVRDWWARWGESSASDLRPVLASIKAHLPFTLRQLNVADSEPLRDALREADQAQRKREQAPSDEAIRMERESLKRLADLLEMSEHREFLWRRVNKLMHRYGYRADSVLLELAQNADDALAQAAEIEGGPLPSQYRRFVVRVQEGGDEPTVEVLHWGRTINDTGDNAFPEGRNRQWDQDLYFMMLMNLSSKLGEVPGEGSLSATTGRFGLGFKSIHLVSECPSVVSGYTAFAIAGGTLPIEHPRPDDGDRDVIQGRRPTIVRMPLRKDKDAGELIQSLFGRFGYARALLPVFARQIREVEVKGGPYPDIHEFDGKPIDGAPAWSIGGETKLPKHRGRWRILRFRPSDSVRTDLGTTALAVGLRDRVPAAFAPDVPFLWNVTPTSENWACRYVVNGPFKLDPGRTHVSLDDETTLRAVAGLGEELGNGLIELHDALTTPDGAAPLNLEVGDSEAFVRSLWEVLASGADDRDTLRRKFVHRLHGDGRGLSAWMAERSVVPTNLPAPFPPVLGPLGTEMAWEVTAEGLDNSEMCAALDEIKDEAFRSLVGNLRIVSGKTDQLLSPLFERSQRGLNDSDRFGPLELLAALAEAWDYRLTPARLHALRPLSQVGVWNLMSKNPNEADWRERLQACSVAGDFRLLSDLLLPDLPASDESLLAAFAPSDRVLDPGYIECSEDWKLLRWLRVGSIAFDASEIADWYRDLDEDARPAALRYLLDGRLWDSVLSRVIQLEARPSWLRDFEGVRRKLQDTHYEHWRRWGLLGALFPARFPVPEPAPVPVVDSDTFFDRLSEWWDDDAVRSEVTADYESRTWPEWLRRDGGISDGLQAGSEDSWLALLVLGACQSLGRTRDEQHRGFLERAYGEGWWDVFKNPDDDGAWMRMLREWQDEASGTLPYARWMSLFPTIYQLSRYRDVYVRLLKSVGQRRDNMYDVRRLLAPKVDQALSGAGTHFGAPPAPLNMGLHWVLRELVRLRVVEGEHLYSDCWMPSDQVFRLLGPFGLDRPDDAMSNPQKARAIFEFMAAELDTATPNLHRAFDIPIRHVASDPELGRRFGLEQ